MSIKNSNDAVGNRSRDLQVCSAVPQPLRRRVLQINLGKLLYTQRNVLVWVVT
jgi:phage FluMu gp28-like protein